MQSVKEKLEEIQDIIREFDIKFVDLAKKADGNNYVIFLVEGNALKGEAEKMGAHMEIWKGDLNWNKKVSLNKTVFLIQEITRLLIKRNILTLNDHKL